MDTTTENKYKQRFSYGSADFACNLIWTTVSLYLMFFYTDVYGLAAVQVSLLFLFTRILDGFTDIFMGVMIDKTHTRWGQSRPYFLFGAIPFVILAVMAFYVPDFGEGGKIVYAYITYIGLSMAYTMVNIPLASILPRLSSNAQERSVLVAFRMVFASIGGTVVTLFALPLVNTIGGGDQAKGFFFTMLIFAIIGGIMFFITFKNIEEKVKVQKEKISVKESFTALRGNKPWFIITFNIVFLFGAMFISSGSLIYYFTYYVGNQALGNIVATISTLTPTVAAFVIPFLTKKKYKKNIYQLGGIISIVGYILLIIANTNTVLILISSVIIAFGMGMRMNLHFSMQADPIDYGEYLSGVNASGLLSSFSAMAGKVTMAITGALSSLLLAVTGYIPNGVQPESALFAIQSSYIILPLIFTILSMALMHFYNLDKIYPEVRAELDSRIEKNEQESLNNEE